MKTFLNIFLMLLAMLVPFSSLADKIEKSEVVISNDVVVVSNLVFDGSAYIYSNALNYTLQVYTNGGELYGRGCISLANLETVAGLEVSGHTSLNTLKITDGAAVGSTWVVTNINGTGTLQPLCAFRGKMTSTFGLTNAVVYDFVCSEEYDYGNNYDGTSFVAPVKGLYEFGFEGLMYRSGSSLLFNYLRVRFTGSALLYAPYVYGGSRDNTYGSYHTFWSGTLTNNQIVKVAVNGVAGYTNYLYANYCFFEGKLIRALP